jgi:hypothetical protein
LPRELAVLGHDDHRVDDDDVPVPKTLAAESRPGRRKWRGRKGGIFHVELRARGHFICTLGQSLCWILLHSAPLRSLLLSAPEPAQEVMHPPGPRGHWQRSCLGTSAGRERAWGRQDSIRPSTSHKFTLRLAPWLRGSPPDWHGQTLLTFENLLDVLASPCPGGLAALRACEGQGAPTQTQRIENEGSQRVAPGGHEAGGLGVARTGDAPTHRLCFRLQGVREA